MSTFLQDARYAFRILRKNPGFSVIAALTLALGIGANTAIFSVSDALLRKPVPLPDLDRLTMVFEKHEKRGDDWNTVAPANYLDWKAQNTVFASMACYRWGTANLTSAACDPERLQSFLVSAGFFDVLGVKPALGRTFLPDADQPGREDVAVLGYGLWQRRFAADSHIVGSSVQLDGRAFKVIGVMPKDFVFPVTAEMWIPLAFTVQDRNQREARMLFPMVRLKPGVSAKQVRAEMSGIARRLQQQLSEYQRELERNRHPGSQVYDRRPDRAIYSDAVGGGRLSAADRLRQRGEPPVRPRHGPDARSSRANGSRSEPLAHRPATYIPARRATRVDPIIALRYE